MELIADWHNSSLLEFNTCLLQQVNAGTCTCSYTLWPKQLYYRLTTCNIVESISLATYKLAKTTHTHRERERERESCLNSQHITQCAYSSHLSVSALSRCISPVFSRSSSLRCWSEPRKAIAAAAAAVPDLLPVCDLDLLDAPLPIQHCPAHNSSQGREPSLYRGSSG